MPVLIFSTSNAQPDIDRVYELGAHSYVKKPDSFNSYKSVVEDLCNFWLRTASTLPAAFIRKTSRILPGFFYPI